MQLVGVAMLKRYFGVYLMDKQLKSVELSAISDKGMFDGMKHLIVVRGWWMQAVGLLVSGWQLSWM